MLLGGSAITSREQVYDMITRWEMSRKEDKNEGILGCNKTRDGVENKANNKTIVCCNCKKIGHFISKFWLLNGKKFHSERRIRYKNIREIAVESDMESEER
ncbi:hypothetical protein COBT_003012, partial [Conglomerata obtusa]